MSVERVDFYSDEEYQYALYLEEQEYLKEMEKKEIEEAYYKELYYNK